MRASSTTIVAFSLALGTGAPAADALPALTAYSQTANFAPHLAVHTNELNITNLLVVTLFLDNDGCRAIHFKVETNASAYHYILPCIDEQHPAAQSQAEALSSIRSSFPVRPEERLDPLRKTLSQLPKENRSPPLDRLMIVSFKENARFTTRLYDRDAQSEAMGTIYAIVGLKDAELPRRASHAGGEPSTPTNVQSPPHTTTNGLRVLSNPDQVPVTITSRETSEARIEPPAFFDKISTNSAHALNALWLTLKQKSQDSGKVETGTSPGLWAISLTKTEAHKFFGTPDQVDTNVVPGLQSSGGADLRIPFFWYGRVGLGFFEGNVTNLIAIGYRPEANK